MIEYENILAKVCSGRTNQTGTYSPGQKGQSQGVLLSVWGAVDAMQDTDLNLLCLFVDEDAAFDERVTLIVQKVVVVVAVARRSGLQIHVTGFCYDYRTQGRQLQNSHRILFDFQSKSSDTMWQEH